MSIPQRDVQNPERPLAFDSYAQPPRRGPAPVSLIVSLVILAGLGGGVVWLYRGGVRQPDGPPAPVGVPVRDVRVDAPPQPQTPDPAAGLSIYKTDPNATPGPVTFAPPPEQPAARPGAAPVTAPPAAPPPPLAAQPIVAQPLGTPTPAVGALAATPAPTVARPVKSIAARPVGPKAASIDTLLADSQAVEPVEKPAVKVESAKTETAKTETAKTETAKTETAKTETAKTAAKTAHGATYVVQIGAFSTQAQAEKSWSAAADAAGGAMAGKGKHVALIAKANGPGLYRTDITGFHSRDDAMALCARLKAAGRTCFVR